MSWILRRITLVIAIDLILLFFFGNCSKSFKLKDGYNSSASTAFSKATYAEIYQTIFAPKCLSCHGADPKNIKANVDLSSYEKLIASNILQPYDSANSLLYTSVKNGYMPPGGHPLIDTDQNQIKDWINAGALEKENTGPTCSSTNALHPRLSNYEYKSIINDLSKNQILFNSIVNLPDLPTLFNYDTISEATIDKVTAEAYLKVAQDLAPRLLSLNHIRNLCGSTSTFKDLTWNSCGLPITTYLGQRLYRRPLRSSELSSLQSLFTSGLALGQQRITTSTTAIQGNLDGFFTAANGAYIAGWVYDPDWPERNVEVQLYIKAQGTSGLGTFVRAALANLSRPDVNSAIGTIGNQGFAVPIPTSYLNGQTFTATIAVVGTSTNALLPNGAQGSTSVDFALASSLNAPVATGEMDRTFQDALENVIVSLLISPNFLYKMEYFPDVFTNDELPYKLAARLSLAVGSTFPDESLWSLAQANSLNHTNLESEAQRLLTKYSSRFASNFAGQWLGFRNTLLTGDPNSLGYALAMESKLVFEQILLVDKPIGQLLEPGFTYLNSSSGAHYSLSGSSTLTDFIQTSTSNRGGLMSQAQFLTRTATINESHPIKRGIWVLDSILCRQLPALGQATFEEIAQAQSQIDPNASVLDKMAFHRNAGARCSTCHNQIDPIGLALENYDKNGQYRSTYSNGKPVVANLFFNGSLVSNPNELASVLGHTNEFRTCVKKKMGAYLLGVNPAAPGGCGQFVPENTTLKSMTINTVLQAVEGK